MIINALSLIVLPSCPALLQAMAECGTTIEGGENSTELFKHNPAGAHSWCYMKPFTPPTSAAER